MFQDRFYIGVMGFFLAALIFGLLFFLTGMAESTYSINDGIGYGLRYIDKPKYDANIQGVIFAVAFIVAGCLMILLVILPDKEHLQRLAAVEPPQPRRRPQGSQQQTMQQQQAVQQPPQPAAGGAPPLRPTPTESTGSVEISQDAEGGFSESAPPVAAVQPASTARPPKTTVEEDVLMSEAEMEDDLPIMEFDDANEEDVVYGAGRVTDDSMWSFIETYPDSAVKFLYRKTLENKALAPTDEDIYRKWEARGMTRSKVRALILELMGWETLPEDFPHNIWKSLRDQIFEMHSRV